MRFEYDPQLVEQATFLAARQDAERECALHEALDGIYKVADAELRRRLFREGYAELFRRFGLEQIVPRYVHEFSLITGNLSRCIVREAERAGARSVDLYRDKLSSAEGSDGQVLIIAICPNTLLHEQRLAPWLYRQLQHVEDMLDRRFAYDPNLPALSAVRQNIIRDRYAALWDVFVEGRLIHSGRLRNDDVNRVWEAFAKTFARNGNAAPREVFEKLLAMSDLTHAQLLAWATQPDRLLGEGDGGGECRGRKRNGLLHSVSRW